MARHVSTTDNATPMNAIRIGIGGWTYAPWRNNFYPAELRQADELQYASQQLTAIEVNGTFYGTQKPATFAKWRDATPSDFVFSLKAPRYTTHRSKLADAGETVNGFVNSGIAELGDKLGPLLWQFPPSHSFDADDFEKFLALLPLKLNSLTLRHVLDVRHPSFMTPDYLELARRYNCATVFTDSTNYPSFADITGDFIYIRLMCSNAKLKLGYSPKALDQWKDRVQTWQVGKIPSDLPQIIDNRAAVKPRDVFLYFINGAKERAPHAAVGLLSRLNNTVE